MTEENPEHIITENDNLGQMEAADASFREFAEKLMAEGLQWGAIAYSASPLMVDSTFDHARPEEFADIAAA